MPCTTATWHGAGAGWPDARAHAAQPKGTPKSERGTDAAEEKNDANNNNKKKKGTMSWRSGHGGRAGRQGVGDEGTD